MSAMGAPGTSPEYLEEDVIDLREYWQALLRRKWVVAGIFLAAVTAAVIFSLLATPIYEATTTILVQDGNGAGQLALFEALGAPAKNTNQNYVEVLKSRTLAERAMRKLGYDYDVNSQQFAGFKGSISIQLVTGTDAIRIKVQDKDPVEATHRANAVVDAFMDLNQEVNTEEARSARSFIEQQLKVVEADLRQAEDALRAYKEKEKTVQPSEEAKAILNQLTDLEKGKAEATVALSQIQRQLTELRNKLKKEAPTTVSATVVSSNPLVLQYKTRLFELESQVAAMQDQYDASHPKMASLNAEIASVKQKLSKEVERVVSSETRTANPNYQVLLQQIVGLEVENVAQQARRDALQKQISQVETALTSLPSKELQLSRLMRNQSVSEQIYMLLKNKHEEYRISEAIKAAGISVIDRAITPTSPIKPKKKLNVAIAGFLGLFTGVGLVFLLEFMDTSLKTAEDVEKYLGLPVLGRIPVVDDRATRKWSGRSQHHRQHNVPTS